MSGFLSNILFNASLTQSTGVPLQEYSICLPLSIVTLSHLIGCSKVIALL